MGGGTSTISLRVRRSIFWVSHLHAEPSAAADSAICERDQAGAARSASPSAIRIPCRSPRVLEAQAFLGSSFGFPRLFVSALR